MFSLARLFTSCLFFCFFILCAHGAMTVRAAEPAPLFAPQLAPPEGWLWEVAPYPAMIGESFVNLPEAELRAIVYTALPHLAIDDETVEAAVADDIALLFRAAVGIQLLKKQGRMDAELRVVARTLAFYLERVGRAYAENATVRDTFDRLPRLVPEGSRQVVAALGASLALCLQRDLGRIADSAKRRLRLRPTDCPWAWGGICTQYPSIVGFGGCSFAPSRAFR